MDNRLERLNQLTTFYLVRHAHAHWRPDDSQPLSPQGQVDAQRVADILQAYPIALIYASPYRRARETVEPLAARLGLTIHTLPALRERRLAAGKVDDFAGAVEATWRDPAFAHPGGETNTAAQARGVSAILELLEKHLEGHIVLATHGNLLALSLKHFDPSIDFAFWQALTMPDIFSLALHHDGKHTVQRLWSEGGAS